MGKLYSGIKSAEKERRLQRIKGNIIQFMNLLTKSADYKGVNLNKVEKYRDLILFLEIGAYLHDIGKLSSYFVISKAKGSKAKDFHGQILFVDLGLAPASLSTEKEDNTRIIPESLEKLLFTPINELLGMPPLVESIDLSISLSHLVCAHHNCSRCLYLYNNSFHNLPCRFKDKIQKNPLLSLLRTVDHIDASNASDNNKQGFSKIERDNFFYPPTKISVEHLNSLRKQFYGDLNEAIKIAGNMLQVNKAVKKITNKYFVQCLSETRKYGNDITLLDHSKSVAAFYKMFLFDFFIRGRAFPKSFFDVHFRILEIASTEKRIETYFSEVLAMSNLVARSDNSSYFIVPNMRSKKFLTAISENFNTSAAYGPLDDFSVLFNETLNREELTKFFLRLKILHIKNPEDIKADYNKEKAIQDIKKTVFFAILRRKEALARKLKSLDRHLSNLENGNTHDKKNIANFIVKKHEMEITRARLEKGVSMESIKNLYGWESSRDGEKDIYDFFSLILSPIRPPSPNKMSDFMLKQYLKHHSFKRIYEEMIEYRPLILGRIYAFFRTIKRR